MKRFLLLILTIFCLLIFPISGYSFNFFWSVHHCRDHDCDLIIDVSNELDYIVMISYQVDSRSRTSDNFASQSSGMLTVPSGERRRVSIDFNTYYEDQDPEWVQNNLVRVYYDFCFPELNADECTNLHPER